MRNDDRQSQLEALSEQLEARIRAILNDEEYGVFVAFSERRRQLPDAMASIQEMAVLRIVTQDEEAMRLRRAMQEVLRHDAD